MPETSILALPGDLATVEVTGHWVYLDGAPASGQVVIRTAPGRIVDPVRDLVLAGPVRVPLDEEGRIRVEVPATDAEGLQPQPWHYTVRVELDGGCPYTVQFEAPESDGTVDLADHTSAGEPPPDGRAYVYSVNGQTGHVIIAPGDGSVATINGRLPDAGGDVSLDAADVGAVPSSVVGTPGGVASLDADGMVPSSQLPEGSGGGGGTVVSVAGVEPEPSGDVPLTAADIGADPAGAASAAQTAAVAHADALTAADVGAIPAEEKATAGGVASLGADGIVPAGQLPESGGGEQGPPGEDGREVELQTSATHVQWRYEGDTTWVDLVALSAITGAPGDDGAPGVDGADGREVELRTGPTHIQWRYAGDDTWVDLVALADITGPEGPQGQTGAEGPQGPPGEDGSASSGILNVIDYGADPTGAAASTAAIQAALDAAQDGGWVYAPPGTYTIDGTLRIYRRTRLTLAPGAVIRRTSPGTMLLNGDADQDFGGHTGHGDLIIEGGTWDANGTVIGQHNMVLSIGHARNVTIRDTTILDVPGYHAIEINSTETCRILNVVCAGFVDSVGDRGFSEAIQLDGAFRASVFGGFGPYDGTPCRDLYISGCTVTTSTTPGSGPWGRGIGSHSAVPDQQHHDIRVTNNHIGDCREYAVGAYIWRDAIISSNTIRACGAGIWARTLDSSKTADRTRPDGSTITGSQPLSGLVITNNVVNDTGTIAGAASTSIGAIIVEGEVTGLITEVVIGDNMVDGTTGSTGLRISNVENYSIARNVLNGVDSTAISQLSTRNGLIADNSIANAAGSGISVDSRDLAAGVPSDIIVSRNMIRGVDTNGIHVLGGSEIDIGDNRIVDAASYGMQLSTGVSWSCVKDNRVRGTGSTGINVTTSCTNMRVQGNDVRTSSIVVPETSGGTPTDRDLSPHNVPQAA